MLVVIDYAPVIACDTLNNFLDVGKKKFLEDIEAQGICVAEVPNRDEWSLELHRKAKEQRYRRPTDEEHDLVKKAKIVNSVISKVPPSEQRQKDTLELAKKAKKVFEADKVKNKKYGVVKKGGNKVEA